ELNTGIEVMLHSGIDCAVGGVCDGEAGFGCTDLRGASQQQHPHADVAGAGQRRSRGSDEGAADVRVVIRTVVNGDALVKEALRAIQRLLSFGRQGVGGESLYDGKVIRQSFAWRRGW